MQVNPDNQLLVHSGDPSYDIDHRGYWSYGSIDESYGDDDINDLAIELQKEVLEQYCTDKN